MRGILKYQLNGLKDSWHNGLSREVFRVSVAFPILVALAFILCMAFPTLQEGLLSYVFAAMDGTGALNEDGKLSAMAIFSNNLRATVFIMFYGLIPFIQLPALALGVNALVIGVLAAWYVTQRYSIAAFLAALLPHGVLELPALVIAFSVGLYVCSHVTRRLFRRDENALHIWDCLVLMSRILLLVLFPLLAAASVLEAYVTPLVASLFF